MYYEMWIYMVQIGKMNEYLWYFEKEGLLVIFCYVMLVGWWYMEIGELNQVVYIWVYESFDDCIKCCIVLYEDLDWFEKFVLKVFLMFEKMELKLLCLVVFLLIR